MKNKKIGLLATLAISFIALICASTGIWVHNAYAQNTAEPVLVGGEIEEMYLLDEYLSIPDAQIICGDQTANAKVVVTKPDGEVVQSTSVLLDQGGVYTIEYRAVIGGELKRVEKTFTVQTPMFSGDSHNTFAVYGEDTSEFQTGLKGVNVQLAEGDVLHYNDIIDLKASEGQFLEFFFLPQDGAGTIDLRKLTVTLTDIHNSNNVLTIIMQCYRGASDEPDKWFYDYTYVLTGGQNQTPSGYEAGSQKLHVGNDWGAPTRFSFYGKHGDNAVVGSETMKLIYNEEANAVFANGTKVVTLDDLNYFENAWGGFTTGEVKMDIWGDGFSRPLARLMITRIGTNNLNQTILTDEEAPEITIDYEGYDADNLPSASKGYSYPVFDATAMDKMFGGVPVKTTVYYNYESNQRYQVEVVDGKFKTDRTGYYTIEYSAVDGYRNVGKELITIECKAASPEISARAIGSYATTGKTGELIFPAEISYIGGTGKVNTYAIVKAQDGEEIPMDDGFRPEYAGIHTVTLYAEDMLGKIATCAYALSVEANEEPVFLDEVVLPRYFVAEYNYEIPTLCAYDYSEGKEEISTTISVKDGGEERELTDCIGKFTPDADGYATIVYTATGKLGSSQKEYKVPVVDPWITVDSIDLTKYFQGENITLTASDDDITVSATQDTEYQFITPVIAHKFKVEFSITGNEFTRLQLVFADSLDANVQFTIEIDKASSKTETVVLKINGVETRYTMTADFYNGKTFYFYYDDVNKLLQDDAMLKQTVKNADGSVFEGFPSRKLYVTARMIGVSGNAAVAWKNFGGQILSNTDMDSIKPSITIEGDYAASYEFKSVCEIYSAVAADVLSPETENGLTVYDPNGAVVTDVDGVSLNNVPFSRSYFINLQYYGSYSVVYTSTDIFGREQTYYYAIYVTDNVAPKILLESEIQTQAKVGEEINVIKAVAVDNLDGEVVLYTYVINPSSVIKKVENGGSFEATEEGVYEIRYICIDSFGNLQFISYKVTVKGVGVNLENVIRTLIYIGAAIVAGAILALVILLVAKKKKAKEQAKAKILQQFKDTYGEIHVNVAAVVYGDRETKESGVSQLGPIVNNILKSTVEEIPEGGEVTKSVKINSEKEQGDSYDEKENE